eukprot:3853356-Pleurochrysis_carterae.AAC.1
MRNRRLFAEAAHASSLDGHGSSLVAHWFHYCCRRSPYNAPRSSRRDTLWFILLATITQTSLIPPN